MKRNQFLLIETLILCLSVLVTSVPAQAAAHTYSCGSGDYVVTDGVASGGEDCTGALVLDASVTVIGQGAFFGNEQLTSVVIPPSVLTVGNAAFAYGYRITSVTFQSPSHVSTIEESAFRGLTSLTSLTLPNSVHEIGNFAFLDSNWVDDPRTDHMLSTLVFGQGVTSIGAEVFTGIQASTITIPSSMVSIGDHAFWKLMNLTTLNFDQMSSLTSLESNSFDEMPMLSHVYYCGTPPAILSNHVFPNGVSISNGNCPVVPIGKVTSPKVLGTAKKGKTLTSFAGTWSGATPKLSYKWYRCTKQITKVSAAKPVGCSGITGATKTKYKLVASDKKKFIVVAVTARNSVSSLTSWSKSTSKVK